MVRVGQLLKFPAGSFAAGRNIIAAVLERPVIEKILKHLGLRAQPPRRVPMRESVPHHAG